MNNYTILFVFFVISYILTIIYGLEHQGLVGGNRAYQPNHRYQVAIIGRYNQSQTRLLFCGGGIISDFFILSSAQCFIGPFDSLRNIRFYAILGTESLTSNEEFIKEIWNIYTLRRNHLNIRDDLAVIELAHSLQLYNSLTLRSLELPTKNVLLEGRQGLVAGYGSTMINRITNIEIRSRSRITANSNQNLTYAFVDITSSVACVKVYNHIDPYREMCGIIKPNFVHRHRGLCTHDDGAPLVFENTVVGIANRNRKDCDDTVHGNVYSKVSYYLEFILGVMSRNFIPNTIVHQNRLHLDGRGQIN